VPRPGAVELERFAVRNDLSDVATVVEVVTPDRTGLVYDITRVLLEFRLDLRVAKIATRVDLASDTFYVVGRGGRQLGRRRCRQLELALEERFTR
jgi:[protein-PII] uridylyltransferase